MQFYCTAGAIFQYSSLRGLMKTLNSNSPKTLSEATDPVISRKTPTNKPLEKPQGISLDEWQENALAGLNDKTEPFPPVW